MEVFFESGYPEKDFEVIAVGVCENVGVSDHVTLTTVRSATSLSTTHIIVLATAEYRWSCRNLSSSLLSHSIGLHGRSIAL